MRTVIIMGSARNDGEMEDLIQELKRRSQWDVIDLNDYNFSYFDYAHKNRNDDFLPLMRKISANYDVIVFATPVYWYAMSGILKVFFDRITDLLTIDKETGRKLRNKKMAAISSSYGDNLGDAYWLPFRHTAKYLGMEFVGAMHFIAGGENEANLEEFIVTLNEKLVP